MFGAYNVFSAIRIPGGPYNCGPTILQYFPLQELLQYTITIIIIIIIYC